MRSFSVLASLASVVVASTAVAVGAAEPVPPAIEKIVQRFASDSAGIIVSRQNVVSDQSSSGRTRHGEQEVSVLDQDRKTLAVRVHRVVNNGQAESGEELAKTQAAVDKQYADAPPRITTRFAMPYYPESAADYAFSAPKPCADCGTSGAQSVDFTSAVNDERHVHGTMSFDPATARPLKVEFAPYVFPEPANAGSLTYTFGRYDDGSWGAVRAEEHFSGQAMGITGSADRTTTVLHARHYPTLDEARRVLQAG